MDNGNYAGNINPGDIATLSLLGRGGYGGYGGYGGGGGSLYTGNNVLAAEAHANGTAVHADVKNNATLIHKQSDDFEHIQRTNQFRELDKGHSDLDTKLSNELGAIRTELVRIAGDNRFELATKISDLAAANAKCCCETQKLVIEENTKTRELINAKALEDCQRMLTDANSRNSDNATVSAIANAIQSQTASLAALITNTCNSNGNGHRRGVED